MAKNFAVSAGNVAVRLNIVLRNQNKIYNVGTHKITFFVQELFKMAPDVVERRAKGLEMYMTTLIRRFPDVLESPHLDRYGGLLMLGR